MPTISTDDNSINVKVYCFDIKNEAILSPKTFRKGCKRAALPADKESVA